MTFKGNVRSLEFDPTGSTIFSGGEDKSFQIIDTETFKTVLKISDAHDAALYKIKPINENLLVTGDEDGTVKLWDKRQSSNMTKVWIFLLLFGGTFLGCFLCVLLGCTFWGTYCGNFWGNF